MRALIRSRLAGSPETGAFISFLHMPKPPWSGGTRLEPALGWFPLLLLKAQLKSSKAESNSQQVNIHLQQREDGSGSTEESGCAPGAVPAHVPCPRPHSAILMFVIQDAFSCQKEQQTSCQCCRASLQVSLTCDPSPARARPSQKPSCCCPGSAVGAAGCPVPPGRNLAAEHGPCPSPQGERCSNALAGEDTSLPPLSPMPQRHPLDPCL